MTIKIQTKQTHIPVEIGDLEFKFDLSDESIKSFERQVKDISKEFDKVEKTEDANELEELKGILGKGFDLMLGKGAFDKVYEQTPSMIVLAEYFFQLSSGISKKINEIQGRTSTEKANKYLSKK